MVRKVLVVTWVLVGKALTLRSEVYHPGQGPAKKAAS